METREEKPAAENEGSLPADGKTVPGRRPNAKYRLSRENANGDTLVFYYDRERRLAKASQSVKDLYKDEPPRTFSLLRPLIGNKPRAMLFFTIVIMCLIMLIMSFLGRAGGGYSLAGNSLDVQAEKYGGITTVELKKTIKKNFLFPSGARYTGTVDLAIFPAPGGADSHTGTAMETSPVFYHRVFFSPEQHEEYIFSVPFDSDDLLMVLQTGTDTLTVEVKLTGP